MNSLSRKQDGDNKRKGRNRGKSVPPLPKKKQVQSRRKKGKQVVRVNRRIADAKPNVVSKKMRSEVIGFAVDSSASLKVGTSVMNIPSTLHQSELVYALLTYASNVFYRGTIGNGSQTNTGTSYQDFSAGLAYLGMAIQTISKGATAELTDVPIIFDVMCSLLTEKKVKLSDGIIHYAPAWDFDFDLTYTITTDTGTVYTLFTPTSATTMSTPFTTILPTGDGYATLLRACADDTFGSRIVKFGTSASVFTTDPSCYARNYNYFGCSGDVGSLYSESELEVNFKYPLFAKFVKYDSNDSVVSRIFSPQSGSIVTPVGLSLTSSTFTGHQLENRTPVQYKFIDFNSLYAIVGSWIVACFEATPGNIEGNTIYTKATPFPFTQNEFMWMLRQAVLSIFPEQCHAQFVAPVKASPSVTNSVFQPFIVDSICSPMSSYNRMMLPTFIVENLNMLKSRFYDPPVKEGSKKINRHNWVPVWGVYSGDTPPVFQYTDSAGVSRHIFNTVNTMPFANIWDATGLVINTKVQVNNFVNVFIDAWNAQVEGYFKRLSTNISTISADCKGIASLLPYTRIIAKQGETFDEWTKRSNGFINPIDDFIANKPTKTLTRVNSEKNLKKVSPIEAIPPATLFELETRTITSQHELTTEIAGALNFFLMPSIRLNYTSGDLLTQNAYQVYTGEVCGATSLAGFSNTSQPEIYRLFAIGTNLSAGMFAASSENDVLTKAVATLSSQGLGLDFLKALMGGLSSVIPVVGPILSGLLSG